MLGAAELPGFGGAFGGQQQFGGGQFGGPGGMFGGPGGGGNQFGGQNQFGPGPGQGNMGFGAGGLGVGGGQLGQFGNLGGQFGLQGGDQSRLLMNLIVDTVAAGEWIQTQRPGAQPGMDEEVPIVSVKQLNSLGYYPPARALIIRGTTRYHPASSIKLKKADGLMGVANPAQGGGPIVIGPNTPINPSNPKPKDGVAASTPKTPKEPKGPNPNAIAMGAGARPTLVDPKLDPELLKPRAQRRPETALERGDRLDRHRPRPHRRLRRVPDGHGRVRPRPSKCSKGGLRKGLTTDDWAHESLALALQMSSGRPRPKSSGPRSPRSTSTRPTRRPT